MCDWLCCNEFTINLFPIRIDSLKRIAKRKKLNSNLNVNEHDEKVRAKNEKD